MALHISASAAAGLYQRSTIGLTDVLNVISKRSTPGDDPRDVDLANNAFFALAIINIIIWVPVFLFLGYTLNTLLPALAVVEEDDAPPAYQPVSLKDGNTDAKLGAIPSVDKSGRSQRGPVTAGVWATCRFLYSRGGVRSLFRGLGMAVVLNFARLFVSFLIFALLPVPPVTVAFIFVDLAIVQFSTLWLHTVISASSGSKSFWQRLPAFRAAFRATAIPTIAADLAVVLCDAVGKMMYGSMGILDVPNFMLFGSPTTTGAPRPSGSVVQALSVIFVQLLLSLLITIPANVVLFRCQASLLPEDEDTIVPFDRTFQLESVRAKGQASMVEAFKSFSYAAWKRIVMLYAKVIAITIVSELAVVGLVFAQGLFVLSLLQKNGN
ncbi:putative ubiquitin conjugating protein [Eutypa lata UCREL1]|uniref:Putative ubiquitin conjugating protein n=1 Tax=Eutypa lata (strain UCR-EL1) TaxID=1287681 RepID=M7SX21_EUTLA|nr:putative ubiquitin conjugating protein [Eutypa lata UCREL1]